MSKIWIDASGNILEMEITDFRITVVSQPFDSAVFEKLITLKLYGFRVAFLNHETFAGLAELQVLELNSFELIHGSIILSQCANLRILEMKNVSRKGIYLNEGGGDLLQNLNVLSLRDNNLGSSITEKTFDGLVQVRLVD